MQGWEWGWGACVGVCRWGWGACVGVSVGVWVWGACVGVCRCVGGGGGASVGVCSVQNVTFILSV